ncbi:helix-turn-helix transcriptional regulator [Marinivivus vitaminiproducens]|uniref:helix-turn-helix transcriptional regulator n=1 Tax=Marinivivus vitaminiproducens TaxID=3035935 RepID=UPI00279C82DE|nr:AraC family transcriptional regulator [Geminicoccaceae bacterium SCSIO 64248]
MTSETAYVRRIEPRAEGWRSFAWNTGSFDMGARGYTESVEGTIRTPDHIVLVTLQGGARHLEVTTDCGHRFAGPDRAGAVSFVPAGCERRLRMSGVRATWASIAIRPDLVHDVAPDTAVAPFSNIDDRFLSGLVGEMARLQAADGGLDPLYCETMALAVASYLGRRRHGTRVAGRPPSLPSWRLRRIADYIDSHLGEPIRIEDLASLAGVSAGHLHRSFRATLGLTPLDYVNQRRIQRAVAMLAREPAPIAAVALRVGFQSSSHFARVFRQVTGASPSQVRTGTSEEPRR